MIKRLTVRKMICMPPKTASSKTDNAYVISNVHPVPRRLGQRHTAAQSLLRDLVPESELTSAVSLYSIGFNFARIVGPSSGSCCGWSPRAFSKATMYQNTSMPAK
jgi:hypothetical protein